jgi:hypothetical protein
MSDIVTRLRGIDGFGWQCGQPLKDKGGYWRCSCGCSQPADDWDGSMTITQPAILREAANAIERLTVERDDARRLICNIVSTACSEWSEDVAKEYGWEYLFKEDGK